MAAPLVTVAAVGAGVALTNLPSGKLDLSQDAIGQAAGTSSRLVGRAPAASRSFDRMAIAGVSNLRKPEVVAKRWTTEDLSIRTGPSRAARVLGEIEVGKRIGITGERIDGFAEVVLEGTSRWVTAKYLSKEKPAIAKGLDFTPCGPALPGIVPDMQRAYFAVCNAFPQVQTYGGVAGRVEHNTGHAVDAMVYGDKALGDQIAAFLLAHASELNLYDIIWYQHIWTPVRAAEGWRSMGDRGSATANHMDHVHFGVN